MQQKNHNSKQLEFDLWDTRSQRDILPLVYKLREMHQRGELGGEVMPEDSNPHLPQESIENYHYFTLPMALNYQRNSYTLWRCATQTYNDEKTRWVFNPKITLEMGEGALRDALTKYKVAIQPNKHTSTWFKISETLCLLFHGDVRFLLNQNNWHIPNVLDCIQRENKKGFPYLSGNKICNYWLYVLDQYTNANFTGRDALSVAPDTHVIQASIRLGLVDQKYQENPDIQSLVSNAWRELLEGTEISPIDVHTPLWLWSRGGFTPIT